MLALHVGLDVLGISRVADEEAHRMLPRLLFSNSGFRSEYLSFLDCEE